MRIRVHLDSSRLFRWHLVLLEALKAQGFDANVSFGDTPEPLPTSLSALFDYDHARSRAGSDRFSTHMNPEAFARYPRVADDPRTVTIDLSTASRVVVHPGRVLRPLYDGSFKDYALFHALLERRAPMLEVADSLTRDAVWSIGLPANETPWRIATAFDQVTSRLAEGLIRVLGRIRDGLPALDKPHEKTSFVSRTTVFSAASAYASARATRKIGRLRDKVSRDEAKWHVAWRQLADEEPPGRGLLSLQSYTTLADDGRRYYADPFVFVHEGRRHVFVEEVPEATGRGHISHFEIGRDGKATPVLPVLRESHHLSYPQVFARDGQVWMLPEASASGGVDLYYATRFPFEWEKAARIIGAARLDATLFEHGDRLWIAAGSAFEQSSSWDGLALYFADTLLGPWEAHAGNPVLIDARRARPAGPLWRAEGTLVRPAQDCSQGYGGRLVLNRIDRLDPRGFLETTLGTISFPPESQILGPHTLSRGGGVEVIDLFARPGTLRAGYRQANRL